MVDKKNPDAKALADAVNAAVERLGPLATATLLTAHAATVRTIQASGEYPRAVYGPNGATRVVESKAEEEELGKGWQRAPSDQHRQVAQSGAITGTDEAVNAAIAVRRASGLPAESREPFRATEADSMIQSDVTVDRSNA